MVTPAAPTTPKTPAPPPPAPPAAAAPAPAAPPAAAPAAPAPGDQFQAGAAAAPDKEYVWGPAYDSVSKGKAAFTKGQRGPGVEAVQQKLENCGYSTGYPRGKFGENTRDAVVKFQQAQGISPANGFVDQRTLHALEAQSNRTTLDKDPNFAKLSPAHQGQMKAALERAPRDPAMLTDLQRLAASENFRKLDSATATDVLSRVKPDAASRTNLTDLATAPGFAQLNRTHQRQFLDALDKRPGDASHAADLRGLAQSSEFRHLGDGHKTQVIEGMGRHAADPAARRTIAALAKTPGFAAMGENDKSALLRVATSNDSTYGPAARGALATKLADPAFTALSPADQSRELGKFLDEQSYLPPATTAPTGTFGAPGKRAPYTISAPTSAPGGVKKYEIEIEGKKYPVTIHPAPSGKTHYTPDDVAKALAAVPKKQREAIDQVVLEPAEHPQGGYMAAGSAGTVHVYPGTAPLAGEDFMASAMIHETGHIASGRAWGDDTSGPKWQAWKDAMSKDRLGPSIYGHVNPSTGKSGTISSPYADDYAETLLLYARVKGTPEEAKMRALMPERFRILDTM